MHPCCLGRCVCVTCVERSSSPTYFVGSSLDAPSSVGFKQISPPPPFVCKDVAEEIVADVNQRMSSVAGGGGVATVRTVVGGALVDEGWPIVHAVGMLV